MPKTRRSPITMRPSFLRAQSPARARLIPRFAFPHDARSRRSLPPWPYNGDLLPSAAYPVVENTVATDGSQDHGNRGEGYSRIVVKRRCASVAPATFGGFQRLNRTLGSMEANVFRTVAIMVSGLPLLRLITTIAHRLAERPRNRSPAKAGCPILFGTHWPQRPTISMTGSLI